MNNSFFIFFYHLTIILMIFFGCKSRIFFITTNNFSLFFIKSYSPLNRVIFFRKIVSIISILFLYINHQLLTFDFKYKKAFIS
jgi:hypothetical protein